MVTIRDARLEDAAGIARVHVDSWRTTYAGITSMLLWVLAGNPAYRFYEALGGQRLRVEQLDFDGVMLDEVAYGWLDVHSLL